MDPSPQQISALAEQLSQLARDIETAPDPMTRKMQTSNLVMQAKKTIWAVQDPIDAMMDQIASTFSVAAALALIELGVFDIIPLHGTANVKEIAQKADAEEELIIRLMRQCTCAHIFTEVSLHEWSHNRLSVGMSEHFGVAGKHTFLVAMDEMLPPILALNRYIRNYGAKTMLHTYTETPHSIYYGMPGRNFWEVLSSSQPRINTFSSGLSMWSAMHPVVAIYPFAEALQEGNREDRILAVDVGGGRGLAMLELRKNCPNLKGELVLQDRPYVLDEIEEKDLPGVVKMSHDFFNPQPSQCHGAQVYYVRRVMHDWQDADAALILKNIVPAMAKDSKILVSDMALPEPITERDSGAVWLDIMMLAIGGKERTKTDWELLGKQAGLVCKKVWQEDRFGPLCVVEYVLPEAVDESVEAKSTTQTSGSGQTIADGERKSTEEIETNDKTGAVEGEAEMGGTTPRMEATNGAAPPASQTPNAMSLDGAADVDGQEHEPEQRDRDEDWEERTVVGDREQSIEPGQGA